MSEPRKHHFVPQFYLKHFSPDGHSIWQIVKVKRSESQQSSFKTAIEDTAVSRDYHALDFDGARNANALEKELAKVEGQLADTMKRALESGIDHLQTREMLAFLVSLLLMRVPRYKEFIEQSLRAIVRAQALPKLLHGLVRLVEHAVSARPAQHQFDGIQVIPAALVRALRFNLRIPPAPQLGLVDPVQRQRTQVWKDGPTRRERVAVGLGRGRGQGPF